MLATLSSLALVVLGASVARADEDVARADGDEDVAHHVAPPPAPADHEPTIAVEIHAGGAGPVERSTICPEGADPLRPQQCVLGLGVGFGVQLERRSADRIGVFAGYDFWLIDSNSVFELGTLHAIRGGIRYTIDDSMIVHPFLDAAVGILLFGDTAAVVAVGGVVTAGGGAEIEISESVAFVTAAEAWLFATGPFTTRDGATRSLDFGVNVAVQVTVGVAVLVGSSTASP